VNGYIGEKENERCLHRNHSPQHALHAALLLRLPISMRLQRSIQIGPQRQSQRFTQLFTPWMRPQEVRSDNPIDAKPKA
jgi:hypothetical protein